MTGGDLHQIAFITESIPTLYRRDRIGVYHLARTGRRSKANLDASRPFHRQRDRCGVFYAIPGRAKSTAACSGHDDFLIQFLAAVYPGAPFRRPLHG